ncbi:hypothetical protein TNCV_910091 [Trichonephila clavipes]|uniref:RNase H type-1 domain-containing protein n=1 Tax=Trichonephila clavipes TaxID=2585209 RepID=A0A8X7BDL6_TRICX|nr:hypothetical protein TNCV_910091 [Trichonephila clavipes]
MGHEGVKMDQQTSMAKNAQVDPQLLTPKHKDKRFATSFDFLIRYKEEICDMLRRIVTEDETWVSQITPESKQQSMEWRHTSSLVKSNPPVGVGPSHCGLWGNERADFLAKKGTGILQNFRRDLTLDSAKLEIKRIFRESFRLTASGVARDKPWSTLCKKSHGIASSPRVAVANLDF